ncbi:MAG: divalent metal cation transporter [Bacteroidales bacterium]|nr:divalent metal cation transporter [Bacteroidales bacterium]
MSGKLKTVKGRIMNILLWSIISAAFIGPGTVTTATKAGADFQFSLLWALGFATVACLVLQEASARAAIYSKMNLGQAIKFHYAGSKAQIPVLVMIVGAIIMGCAAYEAGNILGAAEGLSLVFPSLGKRLIVTTIALVVGVALSLKSLRSTANFMGSFVFIMGATFIGTAFCVEPPVGEIVEGLFVPSFPDVDGAGLLILGLVGTTVVPYDLFLGSNVVQEDTTVKDMRVGIGVSVILGGIISMAILIVGTQITRGLSPEEAKNTVFSYALLTQTLSNQVGQWSAYIFGFGMFAAGFTSAITSSLVSALTARSIFGKQDSMIKSTKKALPFQWIAYLVLAVGVVLGFLQSEPVPVIVAAQAFNGLILPFVCIFLFSVINNKKVMGEEHLNGNFSNTMMGIVTWVTLVLGILKVVDATSKVVDISLSSDEIFIFASVSALVITVMTTFVILKNRYRNK